MIVSSCAVVMTAVFLAKAVVTAKVMHKVAVVSNGTSTASCDNMCACDMYTCHDPEAEQARSLGKKMDC